MRHQQPTSQHPGSINESLSNYGLTAHTHLSAHTQKLTVKHQVQADERECQCALQHDTVAPSHEHSQYISTNEHISEHTVFTIVHHLPRSVLRHTAQGHPHTLSRSVSTHAMQVAHTHASSKVCQSTLHKRITYIDADKKIHNERCTALGSRGW